MLNIVVVGTGQTLQSHLDTWGKIPNVNLKGVINTGTLKEGLLNSNVKVINSLQELHNQQVHLVDICTPVHLRAEYIQQVKEGQYVTCELPFAETVEKATVLVKECLKKNIKILSIGSLRFNPEFEEARKVVQNGSLGKSGVIRLSSGAPHPGDNSDLFVNLGVSLFDWIMWTYGKVNRVTAKYRKKENKAGNPVEVALITLRLQDGTIAHIELSWAKSSKVISYELTGNSGMLTYNSKDSQPLTFDLLDSSEEIVAPGEHIHRKPPLQRQFEYFATNLDQNNYFITVDDTLAALNVAEACRLSAATEQPVSLDEEGTRR